MRLLLLLVASGAIASLEAAENRVRHLGRFEVAEWSNAGEWLLRPTPLDALPGAACSGQLKSEAGCGLSPLGVFGGSKWYWYFENCPSERDDCEPLTPSYGYLVEVGPNGRPQLMWGYGTVTAFVWDAVVMQKPEGTFLHIPVRYPGTGAFRGDFLFQWKEDHWKEIDVRSWASQIQLPPCYGIWKGPFLDFETLTYDTPVWIAGDGNCCPSGGEVHAQLEIVDDALRVTRWVHDKAGSVDDPWRKKAVEHCLSE